MVSFKAPNPYQSPAQPRNYTPVPKEPPKKKESQTPSQALQSVKSDKQSVVTPSEVKQMRSSSGGGKSSSQKSAAVSSTTVSPQEEVSQAPLPSITKSQEAFQNLTQPKTTTPEPGSLAAMKLVEQEKLGYTPVPSTAFSSTIPSPKFQDKVASFTSSVYKSAEKRTTQLTESSYPLTQPVANKITQVFTYNANQGLTPGEEGYIAGGSPTQWVLPGKLLTLPQKIPGVLNLISKEKQLQTAVTSSKYVKPFVDTTAKLWSKIPTVPKEVLSFTGKAAIAYPEAKFVGSTVERSSFYLSTTPEEREFFNKPGVKETFRETRSSLKEFTLTPTNTASSFVSTNVKGFANTFSQEAIPIQEFRQQKGNVPVSFVQNLRQKGLITTEKDVDLAFNLGQKKFRSEITAEQTVLPLLERRTEVIGRTSQFLQEVAESGSSKAKKFIQSVPFFAGASAVEAGSQSLAVQEIRGGGVNWKEVGTDVLFGVGLGTVPSANIFVEPSDIQKVDLQDFIKQRTPVKTDFNIPTTLKNVETGAVKPFETEIKTPTVKTLETVGTLGSPYEGMGDALADIGQDLNKWSSGKRLPGKRINTITPSIPGINTPNLGTGVPTQTETPIQLPIQTETKLSTQTETQVETFTNVITQPSTQTETQVKTRFQTLVQPQTRTNVQTRTNIYTAEVPLPPFFPGFGGGASQKNTKLYKASRPSKYVSDVASALLGIKGTSSAASVFTGLGLRPLTTSSNNGRKYRK